MAGIEVKWTGGEQFLATDEWGHTVSTDPGGKGFKAPNLVLAALVGCAGVDVVQILQKKRQKFTAIEVRADKEHAPDPPWTIQTIEVEWTVKGQGLSEKAVRDAVRLAEEKYCSVVASLRSELITTVRIIEEQA